MEPLRVQIPAVVAAKRGGNPRRRKGQGSPAMFVSRGSAGPNRALNRCPGRGNGLTFPCRGGTLRGNPRPSPRRLGVGGLGASVSGATQLTARRPLSAVMARGGSRGEWPAFWRVPPSPGAHEKGAGKDPPRPYREPTQVPLGEEPKASGGQPGPGNSANWPRNFGRRGACGPRPKPGSAGRSDKGDLTV